ncbi:hypothetical protein TIFTF001_005623 [Ficus carica]|uniref:Uncharacterized protein n=1 Tax=Ficus carica TaxID=3494 RepID=A0AA88DEW6_FICCA|nr:hypothetical protein TIFTF001_005623 [Ficus carica]
MFFVSMDLGVVSGCSDLQQNCEAAIRTEVVSGVIVRNFLYNEVFWDVVCDEESDK